jgi:hypothetical protein
VKSEDFMTDITFDILKCYGILSVEKNGWKKEINLVSWSGRNPKIDIRDWAPGHVKTGKGITLSREEAVKLQDYLSAILTEPEQGL